MHTNPLGALVGTIVGDAFGSVLEGAAPGRALHRAQSTSPWRYTDDGAMTIAVAEWLAYGDRNDGAALLQRLAAHYDPVRGFGRGMKIAVAAFERGVPWEQCALEAWPEGSRGNGAAVRVAPVACVRWTALRDLYETARLSALVTHRHPEAIDAALVQACAVRLVLSDASSVDHPLEFVAAIEASVPAFADGLERVRRLLESRATIVEAARVLGTSPLARESVPAALWSFLTSHATYRDAVIHAAQLGGDVDSICALVGALAGALHGDAAIPSEWLHNLRGDRPSVDALRQLATEVANLEP